MSSAACDVLSTTKDVEAADDTDAPQIIKARKLCSRGLHGGLEQEVSLVDEDVRHLVVVEQELQNVRGSVRREL